jgi:hypothetical protein
LIAGAAAGILICGCIALTPRYPEAFLRDERVFDFRDAVLAAKSPDPFHRAALAYTLHNWPEAEHELLTVIHSAPWWSHRAFQASDLLKSIYDYSGRNVDALAQDTALGWRALFWDRALFRLRANHGDFAMVQRKPSKIRYATIDNGIFIPLKINGVAANYQIDTGSSTSFISETEARRLRLDVDPYQAEVTGYSGKMEVTGIALAAEVEIGEFRLRNVEFWVQPDKEEQPDEGVIGLSLLFPLETLRWSADGTMEIGFPATEPNDRAANLAFTDGALVTRAGFGNDYLDFELDTGSNITRLYPRFRRDYAEYLRLFARPGAIDIAEDRPDSHAVTLTEASLTVGEFARNLRPAHVFSENPEPGDDHFHGVIGFDFLSQAATVALDFRAMRMTLSGEGLIPSVREHEVSCTLPEGLICRPGWRCIVRSAGEHCRLDRTPRQPWPGNPLPAESGDGEELGAGFRMAKNHSRTITFTVAAKE